MTASPTTSETSDRTAGTVVLVAIGTLFVLGSVEAGGWLDAWRGVLDQSMGGVLGEVLVRALPWWVGWLATAMVSVLLPFFMLSVGCLWRRLVLWLSCLVVVVSWAPVLALAAYRPDILLPGLAVLMAGLLALLFAGWRNRGCDDAASDEAS